MLCIAKVNFCFDLQYIFLALGYGALAKFALGKRRQRPEPHDLCGEDLERSEARNRRPGAKRRGTP